MKTSGRGKEETGGSAKARGANALVVKKAVSKGRLSRDERGRLSELQKKRGEHVGDQNQNRSLANRRKNVKYFIVPDTAPSFGGYIAIRYTKGSAVKLAKESARGGTSATGYEAEAEGIVRCLSSKDRETVSDINRMTRILAKDREQQKQQKKKRGRL